MADEKQVVEQQGDGGVETGIAVGGIITPDEPNATPAETERKPETVAQPTAESSEVEEKKTAEALLAKFRESKRAKGEGNAQPEPAPAEAGATGEGNLSKGLARTQTKVDRIEKGLGTLADQMTNLVNVVTGLAQNNVGGKQAAPPPAAFPAAPPRRTRSAPSAPPAPTAPRAPARPG